MNALQCKEEEVATSKWIDSLWLGNTDDKTHGAQFSDTKKTGDPTSNCNIPVTSMPLTVAVDSLGGGSGELRGMSGRLLADDVIATGIPCAPPAFCVFVCSLVSSAGPAKMMKGWGWMEDSCMTDH